jgi:hypothetical protein
MRGENMKILMVAQQPFYEPHGTPISVYQRLEELSVLENGSPAELKARELEV